MWLNRNPELFQASLLSSYAAPYYTLIEYETKNEHSIVRFCAICADAFPPNSKQRTSINNLISRNVQ